MGADLARGAPERQGGKPLALASRPAGHIWMAVQDEGASASAICAHGTSGSEP